MVKTTKSSPSSIPVAPAADAAEAAVLEAARAAYRRSRQQLRAARDPTASQDAYDAVWQATDDLGVKIIESAESEEAEEEADELTDVQGRRWTRVSRDAQTYHTLRGPVRVTRKRYRCVRNGPTRCPFEERRGVMARATMPDLGEAIVHTFAEVPADETARLLGRLTGHAVSASRIKRVFTAEAGAMKDAHAALFEDVLCPLAVPEQAKTLVLSVDALSLRLREEGFKQATAATLTFLDDEGDPVAGPERPATTRLGEMPQAGKATVMQRLREEVAAIVAQRPDIALEVVVDGAQDLRQHLLERFPEARHLTDFYHVAERLGKALRLLWPDEEVRRNEEMARWCHKLKHKQGTPFRLWRWLREQLTREDKPVAAWAKKQVEDHAEYIYRQRPWMKYPQALNDNAAIGSGVVEAACKTLVTQRLKISGASWSRQGGAHVLYIRELNQSKRLDAAFRFRRKKRHVSLAA